MIEYAKYHRESGLIVSVGRSNQTFERLKQTFENADYALIKGAFPGHLYYIINGAPRRRPVNPAQLDKTTLIGDGIDRIRIEPIAPGTQAEISGAGVATGRHEIRDGELLYTTVTPGARRIRLIAFPYLPKEFSIHVD